jgi:hypothetical protein
MQEIFREIQDFPGYFVSNQGRVRRGGDRMCAIHKTARGYMVVQLTYNGRRRGYSIHRLVASAFIGEIKDGYEVDHINSIKDDNRLENLEIVTRAENMRRYHRSVGRHSAYEKISKSKGGNKVHEPIEHLLSQTEIEAHILNEKLPDFRYVENEFNKMKRENDLTNAKLAEYLGYASGVTFRANKAYKKVVTGIVRLWLVTK